MTDDRYTGTATVDIKSTYGSAYTQSFGAISDKTKYYDPWSTKSDMRDDLRKVALKGFKAVSTTTGGAGTAGQAMVPVYVDRNITDISRKYTPAVEMFPRVTNQGLTADYIVVTEKGDAFTASEDAALSDVSESTDRRSKFIKYLYSVGRVTGPAMASYPSYMLAGFEPSGSGLGDGNAFSDQSAQNAKQLEVLMRARALKEFEENLIFNGDSDSDSTQFDGLIKQQGTTNQVDAGGEPISLGMVEDASALAFENSGRITVAFGSVGAVSQIRKQMYDLYRPTDLSDQLPFGVPSAITIQTFNGPVPLIPSQFLDNTSGSRKLYMLDMDYIEMRVLQDMTYEPLAKNNDSEKFMLKIYETMIMRAPQFNAFVDNIQ